MIEARKVLAYTIDDDLFSAVPATIRPVVEMTEQPQYPGAIVDVDLGEFKLAVELSAADLRPVIEEAADLWYDQYPETEDDGEPEYASEPAPIVEVRVSVIEQELDRRAAQGDDDAADELAAGVEGECC